MFRPPELLLGSSDYGPEIDMWSVGCIFAELLVGRPLFPGIDEADELDRICKIMGSPTERTMPGVSKLPKYGFHPQLLIHSYSVASHMLSELGLSSQYASLFNHAAWC